LEREGNAEACPVLLLRDTAVDPEGVIQRANASLPSHQKIRNWFLWPDPDFPRAAAQKIRTDVLQRVAQQHLGGADERQSRGDSLADLIARVTRRPAQKIEADAHLEDDLNLSSLDRLELMSALEDRYKVDLKDDLFSEAQTVAQLEDAMRHAAPREREYRYPRWAQQWPITWIRTFIYYLLVWPATWILLLPKIRGREHLRGAVGPVLVISNHITYIDIGLILAALPAQFRHRLATAMGGEVLLAMHRPPADVGSLRRWIDRVSYYLVVALFNVFPLPQRSDFRESFSFAGELADRGWSVLVFPEGRRTPDGKMHDFRAGSGLLAIRLGIPVLPMKIEGLYELKMKHKYFAPGRITIKIGEPVSFSAGDDASRVTRELESRVETL
jgi:long-chain acyl-CoA synthetase